MWGERGFDLPFQICIPLLFSALVVSESAAAAVSVAGCPLLSEQIISQARAIDPGHLLAALSLAKHFYREIVRP